MATHKRTTIRKYIQAILRSGISEVSGRVWVGRPSPRFLEQLPCILISSGPEQNEIVAGSQRLPRVYGRNYQMTVDILVRETSEDFFDIADPEQNTTAEDQADSIGLAVEQLLAADYTLGRALATWDPETGSGLSEGISIVSVDPYTIDTGVEPRALVQRVTVSVPYNMSAFPALKFPKFTGFNADIMRPDYKEPGAQEPLTLLPGKGDFNANY